jgi:hypothetical protein
MAVSRAFTFEASASTITGVTASSIGCILDCDLNTGLQVETGGTPTNNDAIINAFLAQATASNPLQLIMDGGTSTSGIFLPTLGHVSIVGLGMDTGFFVRSGANQDCIHNGGPTASVPFDPGGTAPATFGYNVTLCNFRVNGNRGNGTTGNSNSGDPRGNNQAEPNTVWYLGINLMNIRHVRIENVWLYDIAAYSIRFSNCADVLIEGCRIEAPSNAVNTDGIHFSGPNTDIRISDSYFRTGDDAIALNAPEGYGGDIVRVVIENCVYDNCTTGLRVYSGNTSYHISKIAMSNCTGNFGYNTSGNLCCAVLLGANTGGKKIADAISDFSMTGCTFTSAGGFVYIGDPCGALSISGCTWHSPTAPLGFVDFVGLGPVSSLNLVNCRIYRSTAGHALAYGLQNGGASAVGTGSTSCSIKKLFIDGFNVDDESGQNYTAITTLLNMAEVTIAELVIASLDPTKVNGLASSFTGITTIRGTGVSDSGFQIPDVNMAANCLYISGTSPNAGKLCIQHTLGKVIVLG